MLFAEQYNWYIIAGFNLHLIYLRWESNGYFFYYAQRSFIKFALRNGDDFKAYSTAF